LTFSKVFLSEITEPKAVKLSTRYHLYVSYTITVHFISRRSAAVRRSLRNLSRTASSAGVSPSSACWRTATFSSHRPSSVTAHRLSPCVWKVRKELYLKLCFYLFLYVFCAHYLLKYLCYQSFFMWNCGIKIFVN